MTVVAMTHGELSRYDTVLRFQRGEMRAEDAATLLGIGCRQVYRLLDKLIAGGPEALVSWKRGRTSNRDFGDAFRNRVLDLVRQHYLDFGPTLAAEYLVDRHKITISHETLRKWMIKADLWKDRDARRPRPYPDGTLEIRHGDHVLPYRVFDKIRQVNQAAIVENKHLDAALMMAKLMQEQLTPRKRNNNEPGRRSQGAHMFALPEPGAVLPVKRKRGRPPLRQLTPAEKEQRRLELA